jgi:murein peptide amidase A
VARGTRQDARGVDLNRNFPGTWQPLGHPGSVHYGGPRPASERETRIAVHLLQALHPQITIWYHQAQAVVDRSGGRVALERAYSNRVRLPLQTIPPQPGEATRWQNTSMAGTTAFVVELPGGALPAASVARHARAVLSLAPLVR